LEETLAFFLREKLPMIKMMETPLLWSTVRKSQPWKKGPVKDIDWGFKGDAADFSEKANKKRNGSHPLLLILSSFLKFTQLYDSGLSTFVGSDETDASLLALKFRFLLWKNDLIQVACIKILIKDNISPIFMRNIINRAFN